MKCRQIKQVRPTLFNNGVSSVLELVDSVHHWMCLALTVGILVNYEWKSTVCLIK